MRVMIIQGARIEKNYIVEASKGELEMNDKISMLELGKKLDQLSEDELVLDVRSPEEYRDGHVPGSINIPHEEVEKHVNELKDYKHVYIHCKMGGRAKTAFEKLQKLGLKNLVCVAGSGMKDWIEAGLKIAKS